jgi:hypothetical protein
MWFHIFSVTWGTNTQTQWIYDREDCRELGRVCGVNKQFADMCRDPIFWKTLLRAKEWMPDWSEEDSPGGMTPKAYFVMVCTMKKRYRTSLLALTRETTTIKEDAFMNCESLALTHLPPTLTKIGISAFWNCKSLALTHLPPTLTTLEEDAFYYCTSLALTHLPPTLTTIGERAFEGCTLLALTHLPPTLTTIGWRTFADCTLLALTELPPTLAEIGERAFFWMLPIA